MQYSSVQTHYTFLVLVNAFTIIHCSSHPFGPVEKKIKLNKILPHWIFWKSLIRNRELFDVAFGIPELINRFLGKNS
jgi:hypothetical protein